MTTAAVTNRSLWDKIWKDRHGNIVIWQMPNIPLMVWIVLTVASFFTTGTAANVLSYAGSAGLFVWAILEIWKGVNYLRRALGVIVLLFVIASILK